MSLQPTTGYINNISWNGVDGIWVARESTKDWAVSVIGAGAIRKKFTPLTLSLPNAYGIAIDIQSSNTSVSMLSSSLLHMYDLLGLWC